MTKSLVRSVFVALATIFTGFMLPIYVPEASETVLATVLSALSGIIASIIASIVSHIPNAVKQSCCRSSDPGTDDTSFLQDQDSVTGCRLC